MLSNIQSHTSWTWADAPWVVALKTTTTYATKKEREGYTYFFGTNLYSAWGRQPER